MARPRNKGYKDLPPNLYYHKASKMFVYRHPETKRQWYIPTDEDPIQIAIQANMQLMKQHNKVRKILDLSTEMLAWCDIYLNEILPPRELSPRTLTDYKQKIIHIKAFFKGKLVDQITTFECSNFLNTFPAIQSNRYRSLLIDIFNAACSCGRTDHNPAEKTQTKKEKRKRGRLNIEGFWEIYNHKETPKVLKTAMLLFLITTQRPHDLTKLSKDNYFNERLHFEQSKTGKRLAIRVIPRLKELLDECLNDGIDSPYILHRIPAHTAMAKRNAHITQCTVGWLSREFAFIRDKLPRYHTTPKEKLPTFYEIRSLAKARYKKLGYNSKDLAGHATEKMHEHYLEGHDIWEDIEINVNIIEND